MKPLHLAPIVIAPLLSACGFAGGVVNGYTNAALSSVSEPMQVGDHKYKILYEGHIPGEDVGVFERKAIQRSQNYCKQTGFSYAERSYSDDQGYEFFCMKPGDKLVRKPEHIIIESR